MTLFVGNLSQTTGEADVFALFRRFGSVTLVNLVYDMYTHRSRGFGYVEMKDRDEGEYAIGQLNNSFLAGRPLVVNEVRDDGAKGKLS